jgi:hypothetical protein
VGPLLVIEHCFPGLSPGLFSGLQLLLKFPGSV